MKKKTLIYFILSCFVLGIVGCGATTGSQDVKQTDTKTEGEDKTNSKKVVTVTTSFLNDMVKQLASDKVEVQLIIPAGEDPHLYVPQPNDVTKINDADLLLYHGLHFEGKMEDILETKGIAVCKDFTKEEVGKMEEDGKEIIDPHFWFDISLYKKATAVAAQSLQELLPEEKDFIQDNLDKYLVELDQLQEENKKALEVIPKEHRYLVTPHDAFNYFSRSYDIEVVAPQGVSTDSEVASKDLADTANFIVEHKIKAIFAESTTDPARMEKLKESCAAKGFDVTVVHGDGKELFSDSLAPEGQDGDTYISMYRHNIQLISEHLQ